MAEASRFEDCITPEHFTLKNVERVVIDHEVVKVPAVFEERIELLLTPEEASALMKVLEFVGGSPHASRRGLVDQIYRALKEAKVDHGPDDVSRNIPGIISFT